MGEDDLKQVSDEMQQPGSNYASNVFAKVEGNLVNGDGAKNNNW